MAEAKFVGTVVLIEGVAFARDPQGKQRQLKFGDPVFEGEVIIALDGAQVELSFENGAHLLVRAKEDVRLDQALFENIMPEGGKSALLGRIGEETAPATVTNDNSNAVNPQDGGGIDDGNTFVLLDRVVEPLTPLNDLVLTSQVWPKIDLPYAPPVSNIPAPPTPGPLPGTPTQIDTVTSTNTTEGNTLVHRVTLTGGSTFDQDFAFTLTGGSASTNDYGTPTFSDGVTLVGGRLTVPAGVSTFTITIPTTPDIVYEGDETVIVTVGGKTGTGTIIDNDPPPEIAVVTITNDVVTEGGVLVHTVTLTNTSATPATLSFGLAGSTASAGDFGAPTFSNGVTLLNGQLTVPVGVTSFTVSIPTIQDTIAEPTETLDLTVGGKSAVGTILDNDPAPTIASITDATVFEGNTLVHTVSLAGSSQTATTFSFGLAGISASFGDFGGPVFSNGVTMSAGVLTVPAGVTSFTVSIPTIQDTIAEPTETLGLTVGGLSAVGTILDNDPAPAISSITDATVSEGNTLVHTVSLAGTSQSASVFSFGLAGVTAEPGDFGSPSFSNGVTLDGGLLTVPAGVTSFTISIPTVQDTVFENSETLHVSVGGLVGVGTILDDEAPPVIASITDSTVPEGNSLVHTVTLTGAAEAATTYSFSIAGITASPADIGAPVFSDGVTLSGGVLTVPAGVTSFTVSIPTVDDTVFEGTETLDVTVGGLTGVGTILENDLAPSIASITNDAVPEGDSLLHTVTLSGVSTMAQTYAFNVAGVTASAGDFGAPTFSNGVSLNGGVLTVPAGVTSFTISIPTVEDAIHEGDETLNVSVGGLVGIGTILEDDPLPTVASITDATVTEGNTLVHTVQLAGSSTTPTSFAFTLAGVTASAGDFGAPVFSNGVTLAGGQLTVPAGVTTFTISVPTINDTVYENTETVNVSVGNLTAVGTILDNDTPPAVSSITSDAVVEGNSLVHNVRIVGTSTEPTVYSFSVAGTTASPGDFTLPPVFSNGVTLSGGFVTVPAGVTRFSITIPTVDDAIIENDERLTVQLGSLSAIGTIHDNDVAGPPVNTVPGTQNDIEDTSVVFNSANGNAIKVTNTAGGQLTVTLTVTHGTLDVLHLGGVSVSDNGTGTVTIIGPAAQINQALNDLTFNPVADFNGNAVLTVKTTNGTFTDTDTITIAVTPVVDIASDTAVTDANVPVDINVFANDTFENPDQRITAVNGNAITDGGASVSVANGSVALVGGHLVFTPQSGFAGPVPTFTYTVTSGTVTETANVNVLVNATAVIASVTDATIVEGGNLVHTVTLSDVTSIPLSYAFTLSNGTASSGDYGSPVFSNGVTFAAGTITVPAGVTAFTVTIPTTPDLLDESDETVHLDVGGVTATGTILDDDTVTVQSIADATILEGGDLVHAVTLSGAADASRTFSFSLNDGTATAGDYGSATFTNGVTLSGGLITVPAGVTSFDVVVPTIADNVYEPDETVNLTVGGASAVGTILNDDSAPAVSQVTSDTQTEGTDLVHTVTLTNASSTAQTYSYTLGGGTATGSGTDYTTPPTFSDGVTLAAGVLTVPAGVTSFTITVPTTPDTIDEGVSEDYGLTVGGVAASGTILDDDGASAISSVTDDSQMEGTDLVHTVTLSNASAVDTVYTFSLGGGTATGGGTDYSTPPTFSDGVTLSLGLLTVPAGVTSFTFTVPTTLDTIDEGVSENYNVTVGGVAAVGTILDDDNAPTIASVTNDTQLEGTDLVHTVTLSNASSATTTYTYSLGGGTATGGGTDYTTPPTFSDGVTLAAGVLTVPAGVTTFSITVPTTQDTIDEGASEDYGVTVGGVAATGTITDDDNAPTISSVTDDTQLEGTNLVHTVTLSNPSSVDTTYTYTLADGTATGGGVDYSTPPTFSDGVTLAAGVLTVPAGVTSFTLTVPTTQDTIDEGASENYSLTVGSVAATGTITDDDNAPTIASVTSDTQTEGVTLVHTVTLTNPSSIDTTFAYSLGGGSATGGGVDYTTPPTFSDGVTLAAGVLTVPAGVTAFTITVPTIQDTIDEGASENYDLSVGGVGATGTIVDDDDPSNVGSVTSDTQTEGTDLVHTVTLSNASAVDTIYTFSLGGGSATGGGVDYTTPPAFSDGVTLSGGLLTVPAGVTTFTITVPTLQDTIDEGASEDYSIVVGGVAATGTILDDDSAPTVASVTSDAQAEGTSLVHTVTLSNASSADVTFTYTLGGGSATGGGTDYTTPPTFSDGVTLAGGILTVPAGVTTFTLTVPTTLDTIDEGASEDYNLSVGGVGATGTIIDDDAAPTIASVSSASATESTSIIHTVNLSNASSSATTFTLTLEDVTATGAGADYTSSLDDTAFTNGVTIAGGVITVPAGVTTFSVSVPTTSDTIDEPNETYNLTVGGASGVGTILDDDNAPTISSVSSASATESTSIVHTVNLSNPSSSATTFTLTLGDVSATGGGTDYTSALDDTAFTNGVTIAGGVITVPAGVTTFSVSVPTTSDTIDEADETYNLTVGGASGVGTILDDDNAPTISSVSSASATESTSIVHTVNLSNASSSATTFTLTLGDVTATGGGTDYTSALTSTAFTNGVTIAGGVITVPAGVTTFSVSVATTADTTDEADETYNLTVGGASGVGTILDDDNAPTISSVSSASATESTSIIHTVNLSNASSSATTFTLTLGDVSATGGGTDYTSALTNTAFTNGVTISGGVITVPAGVTTFSVSVPTTSDTIDEPNETYNLTVGGASGVGTIIDDDNAPTISSVSSASATESTSIVHTVNLSNPSSSATTFTLTLGDVSATGGGTDYTSALDDTAFTNGVTIAGGVITVPAGVTTFSVSVPTTSDTIDEPNETYNLTVGGASGVGTVIDDDNAPTISSVSSASATESTSIVHTVNLSNASSSATTFTLTLGDVTAAGGGTDYTSALDDTAFTNGVTIAGGVITVPAGVTTFSVSVPTTSDTIDEADETYNLTVGGASGVGTIIDDDNAPTISSVSSASATESTSIVHTVNLSNASSSATTFTLTLGDVTATGGGTDYTSALDDTAFTNGVTIAGGVITVPAGVTAFSVSVATTSDTIDEADETYNLTVGGASGVGTILDDDNAPTISSVSSASATESTSIVHTVNLSNASSSATTFTLTLGDVTATGGGTDYTSALTSTAFTNGVTIAGGVITVPAGVTTFSVSVPTTSDTIDEADETYNLTVGGASGVGTILDDDNAPTISSVSSASAMESTSIVHTVNLSNASSSATTFTLTLGDVTASGGGTDYTSSLTSTAFTNGVTIAGGVITVPAGVTTFSVSVPTTSDTIDEADETYNLTVGGTSGVGTILDDDAAPTISSVSSASATESTSIVHTVNLSNASSSATTFTLTLGDVTATGGGTDYTSVLTSTAFTNGVTIAGGVITVPAGVTSFSVSVPTTSDTIDEVNETYNLTVGGASGVGTVIDDDPAPTISSVSSASATEATSIVHTVNLSNASSSATTFTLTLGDVTATGGGTDYTSALTSTAFTNGVTIAGGVITVPAGVTSFSVSVPTTSDTIDEPNEAYNLTVGGASGVGTIIDDDPAPTISSVTSASATESTSIIHTVNLSNASSSATTFTLTLADVTATGGGADYTSALDDTAFTNGVTIAGGVITVPAGVTAFSVSVATTSDTIDEANETYNLTVGGASGVGTIIDDDNAPTISSVSSASATEATSIVHTVNLSNASSSATTFTLTLGDVTATGGGTDYTSALTSTAFTNGVTIAGGVITVPAGVTMFSVSVPTTSDSIDEANETYNLTVGGASGVGTVIDDDPAPTISSVTSASATEATSIVHTVSLSNPSSSATTFTLTLGDVTATGGTDYTATLDDTAFTNGVTIAGGVITVPAGVTTFSVSVPTTSDTIDEADETYNLTVGSASGVGTILDDDAAPTISSVSSASATESTSIVHTVNLSNASSSATTFTLTLGDVTATGGGTDYTSALTSTAFTNGVTISGGVITVPAG
ncbi:Calx-beta domain-containing protein, partial [Caenimonas koreensis]|uniref:Calx-beta domain-containing protein n=1 Tax=Caenimonas koreensis TaxID=367474 RepID=UPI0037832B35